MKLVKPSSIAVAIALLAVVIFAFGVMNRVNGEVAVAGNAAECGIPDAQTDLLRRDWPVGAIHAHLCGFHFYNGDMARQVRADHYCSHLNADVWQCIIYESDKRDARLIGVEYIISRKLFDGLPAQEKKLWHSHRYEVMSGQLIAQGVADAAERQLMADFATTYGKTWYLWQVDRGDKLPLGLPKLMMGFTADGQADAKLISARDREFNVDSNQIKARRTGISTGEIATGADAWQRGNTFQIDDAQLAAPPPPLGK